MATFPMSGRIFGAIDVRTGKTSSLPTTSFMMSITQPGHRMGKWIAFASNMSENPDLYTDRWDIFVMPAIGGELRKLKDAGRRKIFTVFLTRRQIGSLILALREKVCGYKNTSLWVAPVDGSKAARNLTEKYDIHIDSSTINDVGAPEMMPPTWSRDGRRIYFNTVLHGSSKLSSLLIMELTCGMKLVKVVW